MQLTTQMNLSVPQASGLEWSLSYCFGGGTGQADGRVVTSPVETPTSLIKVPQVVSQLHPESRLLVNTDPGRQQVRVQVVGSLPPTGRPGLSS